jgi:hypothetical protein
VTSLGPETKTPQNTTCKEEENYTKPSKTTLKLPRTNQQQYNQKTHGSGKSPEANPTKGLHRSDQSRAPVTPGQLRMNNTRRSTPPNPTPDLPIRSTNSHKTLGIVGTPHVHSIDKFWSTKTCWNKRNRRIFAKNTTNPRITKTPKSSPFSHRFGRGIKEKRTAKGSCIYPPTNPKEKGLEIAPRKLPKKGSEIHQKGKPGKLKLALRNHTKSSIHTKKVHSRSSFRPIILPSYKISPWSSQASPRNSKGKWKGKIGKQNELGFQEMVAIFSPLGLYGGNQKSKIPLLAN